MAGVHGLEHVQRLRAAALADDDPVGAHAQRVAHQLADRDLALTLDVLRPRLQANHVGLVKAKLGRILDRDDPVVLRDGGGQRVQQRRLTGAGAARDHDVQLRLDAGLEELLGLAGIEPSPTRPARSQRLLENLRMVRIGPVSDSGGSTALTRLPSGSRASTSGEDSSTRRPT